MSADAVERVEKNGLRPATLSVSQAAAVLEALVISHRRYARRNVALFLLSMDTGMAAYQMATLDWSDIIDPQTGALRDTIAVARPYHRSDSGIRRPVTTRLREALQALHDQLGNPLKGGFLVTRTGNPITPRGVTMLFKSWFKRARLEQHSLQSLRRSGLTRNASERFQVMRYGSARTQQRAEVETSR